MVGIAVIALGISLTWTLSLCNWLENQKVLELLRHDELYDLSAPNPLRNDRDE